MALKIARVTLDIVYDTDDKNVSHPMYWDYAGLLDVPSPNWVRIESFRIPKYDWNYRQLQQSKFDDPKFHPAKRMKSDAFGNRWPADFVVCPKCGQPDNCGDCNHKPITAEEVTELGGIPK